MLQQPLENKHFNNMETLDPVLLLKENKNANQRYGEDCFSALTGKTTMNGKYFLSTIFCLFGVKYKSLARNILHLASKVYNWESIIREKLIFFMQLLGERHTSQK